MARPDSLMPAGVRPLPADAVGIGLRRALLDAVRDAPAGQFDFIEVAPENWIGVGGVLGEALDALAARHPVACHGLSLSLGGTGPLDETFLQRLRRFLDRTHAVLYSEHLSYCSDHGQLYDLLPIPFTAERVHHVAARITRVQDALGRRIAVENASYYQAAPVARGEARLSEIEFTRAVLDEADCDLLLDVNNAYVNAVNHGDDAHAFIDAMPADRVACLHVAGHFDEADDLKIDTHGTAVKPAVWDLLSHAYARLGARPTVLERDFNLPPWDALVGELDAVRARMPRLRDAAHG